MSSVQRGGNRTLCQRNYDKNFQVKCSIMNLTFVEFGFKNVTLFCPLLSPAHVCHIVSTFEHL